MGKLWTKKHIDFTDSYLTRIQRKGTRGDLIKSLAELIKNCDDTYGRAESCGIKVTGDILISCITNKQKKIVECLVSDSGMGMDESRVEAAYLKYGKSEPGINSAIGVGGKDALYWFNNCKIFTVRDNNPIVVKIYRNSESQRLDCDAIDGRDAELEFEEFNRKNISISSGIVLNKKKNGTTVFFNIPTDNTVTMYSIDLLKKRLQSFYTLRKILDKKNTKRTVTLINSGIKNILKYTPPEIEEIITKINYPLIHKQKKYYLYGEIKKSKKNLFKDVNNGENILITSDDGAVLDNQMFGYEKHSGASKLYGELIISDWKKLYKIEKNELLTDNREGLDWSNPFNRKMEVILIGIIQPIISEIEKKESSITKLDTVIEKRIKRVFSNINAMMKKEFEDIGSGPGKKTENTPDFIEFLPVSTEVIFKKERKIQLLINPENIPESSVIRIRTEGKNVFVSPFPIVKTPAKYIANKVFPITLNISGEKIGECSIIAEYDKHESICHVKVIPEAFLKPMNGIQFNKKRIEVQIGNNAIPKLIIDTEKIPVGYKINIKNSNKSIQLDKYDFIINSPNISDSLREENIIVSGTGKEEYTNLSVKIIINGIIYEDSCYIKFIKKKLPKNFFNDVEFRTGAKGRYSFDKYENRKFTGKGIVYIHTDSPVIRKYIGKGESLKSIKNPEALAILADTVTQCICEFWARYRLDNGYDNPISENSNDYEEIRVIMNRIDEKIGQEIHIGIVSNIINKKSNILN